jgi:hypothetical protein
MMEGGGMVGASIWAGGEIASAAFVLSRLKIDASARAGIGIFGRWQSIGF